MGILHAGVAAAPPKQGKRYSLQEWTLSPCQDHGICCTGPEVLAHTLLHTCFVGDVSPFVKSDPHLVKSPTASKQLGLTLLIPLCIQEHRAQWIALFLKSLASELEYDLPWAPRWRVFFQVSKVLSKFKPAWIPIYLFIYLRVELCCYLSLFFFYLR